MPLGVHLSGCPCAYCEACAPILQRVNHPELARQRDPFADDGPVVTQKRSPWDDGTRDDQRVAESSLIPNT